MEQEILKKARWEATVSARQENASADKIWPLLKDFFGLQKYFPNLPTCYGVKGNNGEVGSIRHCEGFEVSSPINPDKEEKPSMVKWSKEKIIAVDPVRRCLSYEIVDSNIGFNSYFSTIKVSNLAVSDQGGCVLEWSFSVDAVEGLEFEDLVKQYQVWLLRMAQKMEDSIPCCNDDLC